MRLVERGLNMPEASVRGAESKPRIEPKASPLPTVTLAEIYLAQGHRERALETLRAVLVRDPNDGQAHALYESLQAGDVLVPEPRLKPESLDDVTAPIEKTRKEPSARRGDLEPYCDAVRKVDHHLVVRWSLGGIDAPPGAEPALFIALIAATWDGPKASQEIVRTGRVGEREVVADAQTVVRVAVGFALQSGTFLPVAHSLELERDADGAVFAWTQRGRECVSPETLQRTSRG